MKKYTLYKPILHNCKDKKHLEKGFTLIEAISTLLMGSIILGAAFSGFFQIKEFFGKDKLTTDINQRLRTAFQTIGPDLQQLGERVTQNAVPTILISQIDGSSEITIRKTPAPALTLCEKLEKDNTTVSITVLDKSLTETPACINVNDIDKEDDDSKKDGWPDIVKDWQNIRNANTLNAYIFDLSTGEGEFFEYKAEETLNEDGTTMIPSGKPLKEPDIINLTINSHTWERDYPIGSPIYLINESIYRVDKDTKMLQLERNGEVLDLVEGIDKLDITATLQENVNDSAYDCKTILYDDLLGVSKVDDCDPAFSGDYTWNLIKSMEVKITAKRPPQDVNEILDEEDDLTLSQQFLPRNRLNF